MLLTTHPLLVPSNHGRVELYLYPPSGPHRARNTIFFFFYYFKNQGEQQPTPWSSYLKGQKVTQPIKKYPAFCGSQKLTITFTRAGAFKAMLLSTLPTNIMSVPATWHQENS